VSASSTMNCNTSIGGGGNVSTSGTINTNGFGYWASATTIASTAAPTNGQLLIGSTGAAPVLASLTAGTGISITPGAGSITITNTGAGGASTIVAPQGRLTLVTGTPVMTSDQTAKGTIYYDCYRGNNVPYYTGSADALDTITSCEVSLTMVSAASTGQITTAGVFDVWWVHGGANRICIATSAGAGGGGGGWASDTGGSNTARGTGYSQVHNTRGYWTNVNAITHCYNGATDYGSVSADQATYLGTIYTTAAGQTTVNIAPAAAAGGSNSIVGLWNAYNGEEIVVSTSNSDASYTYSSATWRPADNSNSNRITWVDGLRQSPVKGQFTVGVLGPGNGEEIGVAINAISGTPGFAGYMGANITLPITQAVPFSSGPLMGLNYAQEMEAVGSGTGTFYPTVVAGPNMILFLRQ